MDCAGRRGSRSSSTHGAFNATPMRIVRSDRAGAQVQARTSASVPAVGRNPSSSALAMREMVIFLFFDKRTILINTAFLKFAYTAGPPILLLD